MAKDVIIACDFDSKEKVFAFLDNFSGRKPFVKIGMELYYAEGPEIVREIKKRGHKIFLDLKLHDIRFRIVGTKRKTCALMIKAQLLPIVFSSAPIQKESSVSLFFSPCIGSKFFDIQILYCPSELLSELANKIHPQTAHSVRMRGLI